MAFCSSSEVLDSRVTRCLVCAADIPEEEARYWAKKLEQLNAMRDQDVRNVLNVFLFVPPHFLELIHQSEFLCLFRISVCLSRGAGETTSGSIHTVL